MIAPAEQINMICKGVQTLVSEAELYAKLQKSYRVKRPLTIKLGLDPSAPDLHLGHAVVLRKIRQLQDLGHQAVIVIGDFTGQIGDPTGKTKGRSNLSLEMVRENAQTYCDQIFRVIDKEKTVIRFNSEWLGTLTFEKVIQLAATTTVARILERDDFKNRYDKQIPIGVHEFFYPLMQAYDSYELQADIELGGTDQTFNILMGRNLQKSFGQEQQVAMFMPILEGLDGVEKMSKSLGNYVGISEPAGVMFKKVMEVPDSLIIKFYELATDEHPDEIHRVRMQLAEGMNPRDVKYRLAKIITELYHGQKETKKAMAYYDLAFGKKAVPDVIPVIDVLQEENTLADIASRLIHLGFIKSKSEFMRLINQGGIRLNDQKLTTGDMQQVVHHNDVMKIGKKTFVRLRRQ